MGLHLYYYINTLQVWYIHFKSWQNLYNYLVESRLTLTFQCIVDTADKLVFIKLYTPNIINFTDEHNNVKILLHVGL